jgi:hypothetical protein
MQGRLLSSGSERQTKKPSQRDLNIDLRLYNLDNEQDNDNVHLAAVEALELLLLSGNLDTDESQSENHA